ncbi:hypothetical protein GCM10023340_41610 [Nocardioides marinquilinus]|uniref:Uncharacterized protein n=1 Tax=Nocardioides marinquilinus TaxID=1210400 RepID=A0ABP9Q1H2_9ACTN
MSAAAGRRRVSFRGRIAGTGSTSGVRIVVGRWEESPLGSFADAMVERPDGHRMLIAPNPDVVRFVAATYVFDEVRVEPITATKTGTGWAVRSDSLELDLEFGRPTLLGRLLRLVPRRVAEAPWWCAATDPIARVVMRGVRTKGVIGERREWYGATGHRKVVAASGSFEGTSLGAMADVLPAPRFGFSSTPPRPSVTDVVTTIELDDGVPLVGPA